MQTHLNKNLYIVLPLFIVIMIDAMSLGMVTPILAPLVYKPSGVLAGYDSAARHLIFGLILGITPLCFMLGAPILGYLSDKFGRKNILMICILGTLFGYICYFLGFKFSLLPLIFVGRIFDGLTSGSQGVAQAAMADISESKQKAINIAFIAVAMTIGLVIGPFIGGVLSDPKLVSWFNDTTPFVFAILLGASNSVFFYVCLNETNKQPASNPQFIKQLLQLLSNKQLSLLLICFFLFELCWSLYFQSINLVLAKQFHFSSSMLGTFSLYIGIVLSLGLLFLVRIFVNRYSLRQIILTGLMAMSLALLGLWLLPVLAITWITGAMIALAVALVYACLIALASNQVSNQAQGLLLGLTDGVLALAFAISGFLSGALSLIHITLPILMCLIFIVLGTAVFYSMKSYKIMTKKITYS